ncbi:MAG: nucleotidyltransferase substrate binding protein [Betaproteobacteria bacterium]|nr:nucleotidyltransferase substrate binding protein [Betaproteobacteria bacterium]
MVNYDHLHKSLLHLARQQENLVDTATDRSQLDQEAVAESVIHIFETCYDCLWKALRRHLVKELGQAGAPASPKPLFRLTNENGMLPSPIEKWLAYADARINTAHDYNEDKARSCLALIEDFIIDAAALYEKMSGQKWQ